MTRLPSASARALWQASWCLLLVAGCSEPAPSSLDPEDFLAALETEVLEPKRLDENSSDRFSLEKERDLKESVRFRIGKKQYRVLAYDLSTPESAGRFRKLRRETAADSNTTGFRYENLNLILTCAERPAPEVIEVFQGLRPALSLDQAGYFLYPLGLCLALAVFVFFERFLALRPARTFPRKIEKALESGDFPSKSWGTGSSAERVAAFTLNDKPSQESLQACVNLETDRMERGLFLMEIVVAAAPLIGLLGTVTGLVRVFSGMPAGAASPDAGAFSEGIAMALLTTILGLAIAIPALVGHAWLTRMIDKRSAKLDWLAGRLADAARPSDEPE